MNNDLISRSELKKAFDKWWGCDDIPATVVEDLIDNAPTVDFEKLGESLNCQIRAEYGSCDDCELSCPRNELIKLLDSARPQGECKNCKHFKTSLCENSCWGWCSIRRATQEGDLETQVPKDYYCSWFEKGGAE